MFIYSFPRPVTLLVEFEGVDDVLPDAVEAAGDGGHGGACRSSPARSGSLSSSGREPVRR